jgi:hypothetical protein
MAVLMAVAQFVSELARNCTGPFCKQCPGPFGVFGYEPAMIEVAALTLDLAGQIRRQPRFWIPFLSVSFGRHLLSSDFIGRNRPFFSQRLVITGVEQKAHFLAMDMPHSDDCFVMAFPVETTEAFLEGHARAFEYFGAVPTRTRAKHRSPAHGETSRD